MSSTGDLIPASGAAEFAAWRQDMERRLKVLEHSPALPFSSSRGGRVRLLDSDDNLMTVFGRFSDGSNEFQGFVMYDVNGEPMIMVRSDREGIIHPLVQAVFVPSNSFTPVTSGTFVTTHRLNPISIYYDVLRVAVQVGSDAATTGEVRLREVNSGLTTTALATTAGTIQLGVFEWLHGVTPGSGNGDFVIDARRTGGAGNINVYMPNEAAFTSSAIFPLADSVGSPNWV